MSPNRSAVSRIRRHPHIVFALQAAFWCILLTALQFRDFWLSRGNLIAGTIGDNRFLMYLAEHWFLVFKGQRPWRAVGIFYPYAGVIGFSDTFFLNSIPYSILRALGIDRYRAFEGYFIAFAVLGFLAMALLLYRFLGLGKNWAIVGAALFTFSNVNYIWLEAAQNYSVMLTPVLALLAMNAIRPWPDNPHVAKIYAVLTGALYALLFFSTFYTAWFLGFSSILIALVYFASGWRSIKWSQFLTRSRMLTASAAFVSFAVFMIPFWLAYGGAIMSGQTRSWWAVIASTIRLQDLWNVSAENLLWGKLQSAGTKFFSAYGLTPVLSLTMLAGGLLFAKRWRISGGRDIYSGFLASCAVCAAIGWLCLFQVQGLTLWWIIWRFVPGSSAIRVTARWNLILAFFVVLVVIATLRQAWSAARGNGGKLSRALLIVLTAFLLAEQINLGHYHEINRAADASRIDRLPSPPSGCRVALIVDRVNSPRPAFDQLDAMLASERFNLPTLTGYSGGEPPGWRLYDPTSPEYLSRVGEWVRVSKLNLESVCAFDLDHPAWLRTAFRNPAEAAIPADSGILYLP